MNKIKSYIIILSLFTGMASVLTSCTEIFEGDLDNDTLVVISPSKDLQTINTQIQFLWDELEDATSYHLRIVSPDFSNLQSIELDSSIIGNAFSITLNPGLYEWQLQAKNALTASNMVKGSIHIDSTSDVSNSTVNLLSPSNNVYINQNTQVFKWEGIYNADVYHFKLTHSEAIVNEQNYTSESINIQFDYDGAYSWEVIGKNNLSQTETQPATRNFTVDTYTPQIPSGADPANEASISLTQGGDSLVTFTWNGEVATTDQAPIKDKFQVASSNAFQNYSIIHQENLNPVTTERQVQVKISESGTYYWRVRSEDEALNISEYTDVSSFTIEFTL